jgi:hypothetical protein
LNSCQTNTWYSSILLILNKMNISNVNVYVGTLCNNVKTKLCDSFLSYWYNLKKMYKWRQKGKSLYIFYIQGFLYLPISIIKRMCTNSDFTNCLSYFEIIKKCIFFSNKMLLECKICTDFSLFVFIYTFCLNYTNN